MNGRVELVSQAEYARRRGVAKSAVAKAVKEKRITLIDGKIDPAVADIQWQQNTRARADSGRAGASLPIEQGGGQGASENAPQAQDSQPVAPGDDYQSLRVRRERASVEREERENAREAKLLVSREAAWRGVFDAFRALRDEAMGVPQRAAPQLVGLADSREIERIIHDELRKAFGAAERRLQGVLPEGTDQ